MEGIDIDAKILWYSLKSKVTEGGYLSGDSLRIHLDSRDVHMGDLKSSLKGRHSLGNCLASLLVGAVYGGNGKMAHLIEDFVPLEHRLEYVRTYKGVDFINDSKSTTVAATRCALEAISPRPLKRAGDGKRPAKPVILIVGGRDKKQDYNAMRSIIEKNVKALILIGEAADKIEEALRGRRCHIHKSPTLKEAVSLSARLGVKGEVVLFSPMCASFDMFKDFENRGKVFKEAVRSL